MKPTQAQKLCNCERAHEYEEVLKEVLNWKYAIQAIGGEELIIQVQAALAQYKKQSPQKVKK